MDSFELRVVTSAVERLLFEPKRGIECEVFVVVPHSVHRKTSCTNPSFCTR